MKGNFESETSEKSGVKKKVRRRVKKKPVKTGLFAYKKNTRETEKEKREAAAHNSIYLKNYPTGIADDRSSQPSRFRQESANWRAGMEDSIPKAYETKEKGKRFYRFKNMSLMQWAAAFMAIVIAISSITSTVVYANYQGEQMVEEAYESLASYEEKMPVTAMTSTIETEELPLAMEEPEQVTGKILSLVLSSVEKDLKIKVVDEEEQLVKGIVWKAKVTSDESEEQELVDDDKDGIMHAENVAAGEYTVALVQDASLPDYVFPTSPMTVAVKAKVEYKVIQDIKDLIKKESEINVAAEETAVNREVSTVLTDTVEWVESTTVASGEKDGYIEVDKSTVDLTKVTAAMSPLKIKQITTAMLDNLKMAAQTGMAIGRIMISPLMPVKVYAETVSVNSVSLNPSSVDLAVGGTATLALTITYPSSTSTDSGKATWTSSDDTVASVDGTGQVKANAVGSATITATSTEDNSKTATCTINVKAAAVTVTEVTLAPNSQTLTVGGTATLVPTIKYSDNSTSTDKSKVTFTSSDSSKASVDSAGKVTAVVAGTATITATSTEDSNKKATCAITVTAAASVVLSGTTTVAVGKTTQLTATVKPTGDKVSSWKSSNESIAKVSTAGLVTGVAAGTATITAQTGGATGTTTITVTAASVVLSGTATVAAGKTTQLTATVTPTGDTVSSWVSSKTSIATVSATGLVTGVAVGTTVITVTTNNGTKATMTITVTAATAISDSAKLVDKSGRELFVRSGTSPNYAYARATYADYKSGSIKKFYIKGKVSDYIYTGWQTIDNLTYFFKKDHSKVTGEQVIGGVKYNFATDGSLTQGTGTLGIDVSKYQPNINWSSVKESGISYVIIRCGYRGASTGALVEDPYFRSHIKGAKAAGLKVGVYFFTTAISEAEAVEEASMCASLCAGYGLNYPVFIDCESSSRAGYGSLNAAQRTSIIKAFCNTIKSAGYTPGVYANKTWLTSYINTSELSGYKIWLAQYNTSVTYSGRYDLWQFTSNGSVNGIGTRVDMNQSYLGY